MELTLLVLALVVAALAVPIAVRRLPAPRTGRGRRNRRRVERRPVHDPGRERRAEQRARELLRSCVDDFEWAMYRDLGFIRVAGRLSGPGAGGEDGYAYLIYPHKPLVAYVPKNWRLLNEYCVEFPDLSDGLSGSRLPASDDVLAKWMALTGDERRLIRDANMHLPGRQVDPKRVKRDLWRLSQWEAERRRRPSADRLEPSAE